jgi:hypothetical protein
MAKIDYKKMSKKVTDAEGKVLFEEEGRKDNTEEPGRWNWWKAPEGDLAKQIAGTIKFISTHQDTRIEQLTASTRLYGNSSAFNFIGPALSRSASTSANSQSNRISFNLCSSVVDTLVSKIAKNKVVPTYITSGGVWGMQKKAEQLSKFTEGLFYDQDVHKKAVDMFRDAGVWGTGIVHILEDEDCVRVERALPHEFFVDQVESLAQAPRQLHRVKIVDRDVMYSYVESLGLGKGDMEAALEAVTTAQVAPGVEIGGIGTAADLICVTESWHLRSGDDADDGLHVICAGDGVVVKEEYKKDYFPFVFFHYSKRLLGFWGQGACERLQNLQQEVNRLMILIQRSMWMGGSFKILVENGSRVVSQHLNNDVGSIINYTGTPPQYVTPPMIQQDIYPYVDALIAKGFQQEGVSQLSASSLKPQGVDSGAALRTFDDIADDRFLFTGQEMEAAVLEIARQCIEVAKDIYSRRKTFKVVFPQATFIESIDWKDIKLKDDEYVLKAFPTSSLPDDPAGKLQTIQEYMQAGLISPRAGRRLMSMPDVEMSDKLANAPEDLLHKVYEGILDDLEYMAPEPEWDLALASQLYVSYYNYAKLNACPEENMSMLRQFKAQLDDLVGLTAPPPAPPQAQPMAAPQPTPQSNLIPNTLTAIQGGQK